MKEKTASYIGFAKKSGNLLSGVNTCTYAMAKGRIKLMILTEDISENSEKKIMKEIRKHNVPYVKYGKSTELSHAAGEEGRSVFGICDNNFSNVILKVINGDVE